MAITGTNDANRDMKMVVRELEVGGTAVTPAADIPASKIAVASITTAGSTTIPAGDLQTVLQAIADLADPS